MAAAKPSGTARIRRIEIGIDCTDPEEIAPFWALATGYTIGDFDPARVYLDLRPPAPNMPVIYFQRVPEAKAVKNRVHLDLYVQDIEALANTLCSAGGSKIGTAQTGSLGGLWQVMADPLGNEFCLCWTGD